MKAFKKGDIVVMNPCVLATVPEYKDKLWTCTTDSYKSNYGTEVVFLEGFSGFFNCDFLDKVNPDCIDYYFNYFSYLPVDKLKVLHQLIGDAITEKEKKGGQP